jgi:hypothetical protein
MLFVLRSSREKSQQLKRHASRGSDRSKLESKKRSYSSRESKSRRVYRKPKFSE